ncbi:hypothetical protein LTR53_002176 [Teratosphaeriaceae sp. CCFEE 6253]|nr:hypothetical protein LTR53_002176 [Teratosphaeriaceae sp. CCFEE 6253]
MDAKVPLEPPPAYEDGASPTPPTKSAPPRPRAPLPLQLPALNMIRGKRIILASASPRRRQLLAQIGLTNLEIVPSTVPENQSHSLAPFEYVLATASEKCRNVYAATIDDAAKGEPALVIAADTVISTHSGQILEKPRSEADHITMLRHLRDSNAGWHKVHTAVVVMAPLLESLRDPGYAMESHVEETAVKFDQGVTDALLEAYVRTREGADKAGGYAVQGAGSVLVERLEGSWDNVVGLPLRATLMLIERVVVEPEIGEEVEEAL